MENDKTKNPEDPSEGYTGNLEKTQILQDLFESPKDRRDASWKDTLLLHVADASFACGDPQVVTGPDGFPYFQLRTPEPYKEFQCFVLGRMADDFLLMEGLGVVINLYKGDPDWVFSYGDVLNFSLNKEFYSEGHGWNLPSSEVVKEDQNVLVGQPSETILPGQVRKLIREFLAANGVGNPKVLLMNRQVSDAMVQELVFNMTPDQFENQQHFDSLMKSLSWYLPRQYAYVTMSESVFGSSFEDL